MPRSSKWMFTSNIISFFLIKMHICWPLLNRRFRFRWKLIKLRFKKPRRFTQTRAASTPHSGSPSLPPLTSCSTAPRHVKHAHGFSPCSGWRYDVWSRWCHGHWYGHGSWLRSRSSSHQRNYGKWQLKPRKPGSRSTATGSHAASSYASPCSICSARLPATRWAEPLLRLQPIFLELPQGQLKFHWFLSAEHGHADTVRERLQIQYYWHLRP